MKAEVMRTLRPEQQEMRKAYCEAMMDLAKENKDVLAMDADLMGAMGMLPFREAYPEQTVDCGIQEANMIGVAAGLSALGKIPFAHSFGPFVTRRACDQVFMSGAYARLNVKVIGSDPGITAQINGGTHMPFEDMGIMIGIPQMTVLEPTDVTMLKSLMPRIAAQYGMFYMRLVRKQCMKVYQDGSEFEIGRAVVLRKGTDVTIVASGFCVAESLKAAEELAKEGISAEVIDSFTWKPLDEGTIVSSAEKTGLVVTAENHNIMTGLGASVARTLAKHCPVPMEFVGIQDEFGEVGNLAYLAERFGLTAESIVKKCRSLGARKRGMVA